MDTGIKMPCSGCGHQTCGAISKDARDREPVIGSGGRQGGRKVGSASSMRARARVKGPTKEMVAGLLHRVLIDG